MEYVDISDSFGTAKGKPIEIKESAKHFVNAPEWANYYTRDCGGDVIFFENKPSIEWQHWYCNDGRKTDRMKPKPIYDTAWRKSIRKRPE